ncbi:universal stress protein [Microbacterium luticocti]|uniref:universal stress protein n=1 Tax=Microbacterium luticocti TaxID=451764 RepID=UPI000420AD0B|nr:universal stress protein [Microbacterium luticocti]
MNARYVVGVDDSPASRTALRWARERATAQSLACVRVHVRGTGSAVPADETLPEGPVAEALAACARPGDVLVVGTDKTGFIHGRVFGSLGIQVTALAVARVAVIPDVDTRFRSGVVVGICHHDAAVAVATAGADEAARFGGMLQLVQAVAPQAASTAQRVDSAVAVGELAVRERHPGLEVQVRIVTRPPAEALLDAARNARLLVLGPGRVWGPERTAPGRVLHDVLVNANAPVLVVRDARAVPVDAGTP